MYRLRANPLFSLLVVGILLMSFSNAYAAERLIVVFFSGLCNSPQACRAQEQASASIAPKLPKDAQLINAPVVSGKFENQAGVQQVIGQIGSQRTVLVAYSAGHQGFLQLVNAMSETQLKNIKSVVSLEASYAGFNQAVQRIKSVNPNVEVKSYSSTQFGTNHSNLPGASGTGDAIAALARAGLGQPAVTVPSATPGTPLPDNPLLSPLTQPGGSPSTYVPPITQVTSQDPLGALRQIMMQQQQSAPSVTPATSPASYSAGASQQFNSNTMIPNPGNTAQIYQPAVQVYNQPTTASVPVPAPEIQTTTFNQQTNQTIVFSTSSNDQRRLTFGGRLRHILEVLWQHTGSVFR